MPMSEPMSEPGKKKNLMLTVDENTIEKAKKLRLNISDITERVLKAYTFEPEDPDREMVYAKYAELMKTMDPMIEKYRFNVVVGDYVDKQADGSEIVDLVLYCGNGRYLSDAWGESIGGIKDIENLYPPKTILSKFLEALADAKESRKEEVSRIEFVRKVIEAVNDELVAKHSDAGLGVKPARSSKK